MFTEMELHHIYNSVFVQYNMALDMDDDGVATSLVVLTDILNKLDDHFQGRS